MRFRLGQKQAQWFAYRLTGLRAYKIKKQILNPGHKDHKTWVSTDEFPPALIAIRDYALMAKPDSLTRLCRRILACTVQRPKT